GRPSGAGDAGPDVAHAAGARPARGALGAGDPATATGHPGAPDPPGNAWHHAPWRDGTAGGRMSDWRMSRSPGEEPGAGTPRTRRRLPLHIAEIQEVPAPPAPPPLPGHLCEQCLDAPAVLVVPAPEGLQGEVFEKVGDGLPSLQHIVGCAKTHNHKEGSHVL